MELSNEEQMKLFVVGTHLATKSGQDYGNAVIAQLEPEIILITDMGNIRTMETLYDIFDSYELSTNWFNAEQLGYPSPTLLERLEEQVERLQDLHKLFKKETPYA